MKLTRHSPPPGRAFTLIEMILAIAIAGVVITSINAVLFSAIHLRNRTTDLTAQILPADRVVEVMKQDLLCIMPMNTNLSNSLIGPMGSDATIVGVSQVPLLEIFTTGGVITDDQPWGDLQRVDYWLQPPTNRAAASGNGKDLVRAVTRNLLAVTPGPPDEQQVLISGVQSLQFNYFDGTNWAETWSTMLSNTPVAIKASITFAESRPGGPRDPSLQFLVPIVIAPLGTNAPSTNSAGAPVVSN